MVGATRSRVLRLFGALMFVAAVKASAAQSQGPWCCNWDYYCQPPDHPEARMRCTMPGHAAWNDCVNVPWCGYYGYELQCFVICGP